MASRSARRISCARGPYIPPQLQSLRLWRGPQDDAPAAHQVRAWEKGEDLLTVLLPRGLKTILATEDL